jgi:hypothetical protein
MFDRLDTFINTSLCAVGAITLIAFILTVTQ